METRRETPPQRTPNHRTAAGLAVGLLLLFAAWRVLLGYLTKTGSASTLPGWLPGFAPLAALAVGGGFLLPRRWGMLVPLGTMLVSDLALTAIYGQGMGLTLTCARYLSLAALAGLGLAMRTRHGGRVALVTGSLVGSILFYVVTNTAAWGEAGEYAHTLTGWTQALTVGLPGFPPSWVFFRNSLVSDLLVSMLLAATSLPWKHASHAGQTHAPQAAV